MIRSTNSFIYLSAFSSQGGIEKFNRALIKALSENDPPIDFYSLYDHPSTLDDAYLVKKSAFKSRGKGKLLESLRILLKNVNTDLLLLGHINLAPLALLLKLLRTKQKQVLIAHGVEVWGNLSAVKKRFLLSVDEVWAVSSYTKERLEESYPELKGKIKVFPNTLDPYFGKSEIGIQKLERIDVRKKYGLMAGIPIIYTLCRLSSEEGYKGYDQVLRAMALLEGEKPYYLIAGKYDQAEKERIEQLAEELDLSDRLVMVGFIEDEDVIPFYRQVDLFIMPSRGEGFGIVYLEAMASGLPVIAGNKDGSVDALQNGNLGTLVDPSNTKEIAMALQSVLDSKQKKISLEEGIQKVEAIFGFEIFKSRLEAYLAELK